MVGGIVNTMDSVYALNLESLQATSSNFPGLLVARVALGVFEAALSPGVPFYMCKCSTYSTFSPTSKLDSLS